MMSMKKLRSLLSDESWLEKLSAKLTILNTKWRWISRVLVIGAFFFITILLIQSWPQIKTISWKSFIPVILLALGIYLLSLIMQMGVWLHMLSFQHKVGWQDVQIYTQTVVMRRIPGGIWHWVGRSSSYKANTEVGAKKILFANILEWCLIVVAAIGVYGLFTTDIAPTFRVALIVLSIVLGILLASTWFPKTYGRNHRITFGFSWVLAYGGSWFLGGLILYLFMNAGDYSEMTIGQALAIWALAGGISSITIIAPSGFGIRELSLAILLRPFAPVSYIILVALLLRLTFTLADVIWGSNGWLVSQQILNYRRRHSSPE
jgi:uncharacterized membrane protein YbhN (UPF0104 family)